MALRVQTTGSIAHGDIAALDGDGAWTWGAWFRRVGAGNFTNDLFDLLKKGANCYLYCSSNNTPNGIACYDGSGGETRVTAANLLSTSYQYVALHNAGGGSSPGVVLNGVQQTTNGAAQTFTDVGAAVLQWTGNGGSEFEVAHFKMWSAALTFAQLVQEMHSYRPVRTANLLVWSPYDDGTSARDYSGRGNHGTVSGATQVQGPPIAFGVAQMIL